MRDKFPILEWINEYKKDWFRSDILTGLTLGVILIPQGMAYAMIAGLPAVYGLYASLVPLVIYAVLGTSRQLAVGPAAMDSLFLGATISLIAVDGDINRYIELSLLLTLIIGIFQFVFGFIKLGFLVNFLSRPVISGFTTAAALIIAVNQIKPILGIDIPRNNKLHLLLGDIIPALSNTHILTALIGILCMVVMFLLKKINRKIPAPLVLVILGIIVVYGFSLDKSGVSIIGEIPSGLPKFEVPQINWDDIKLLLPGALALSLIGFMEAISISKSLEEKSRIVKTRPNQELIAIGSSNIIGSFFSSYVITGSFSRSAINQQSGVKTGLATIISAFVILITLLFLTDLFYYLPTPVLGAIIFVSVLSLIDTKFPKDLFKKEKKEFLMYVGTLLPTLFFGITEGIVIGVILSLVLLIYKVSLPHMAVMGRIEGTNIYRNVDRFPEVLIQPEILILRFDARLFYANVNYFKEKLESYENRKDKLKIIIIDAGGINSIDSTAIQVVKKMNVSYKKRGIKLLFTGLKGPVRDSFRMNRIYTQHGPENFFISVSDAIKFLNDEPFERYDNVLMQSNIE